MLPCSYPPILHNSLLANSVFIVTQYFLYFSVVLEFQPSIYIVSEDVGVVALTIVKRTETTRNVTVHFFTKDGLASCKIIT